MSEIDQRVEDKVIEIAESKSAGRKPQPQRDLLERYFAEKLYSLKTGLDEVYEPKESGDGTILSQLEHLKAYWNICRTEVGEIVDLFGEIQPATMNPNHRKIMSISKHYLDLLKANDIINEEWENSKPCLEFAKTAIAYLGTFHTCLTNNPVVKPKDKELVCKTFLTKEITIDAIKQKSKRRKSKARDEGQQG